MEKNQKVGQRILSFLSKHLYSLILFNIYFILCNILILLSFLLFDLSYSNLLIYILALVPTGPAISALIYSVVKLIHEEEGSPTKHFFNGYRVNFLDTLKIWLPILVLISILGVDIHYYQTATGFTQFVSGAIFVVIMLALLLLQYVFFINAIYKFKTLDIYKLSVYYSFMKMKETIGNVVILVITFFLVYIFSESILLFIPSFVCYIMVLNNRIVIDDIKLNFIAPDSNNR